VLPFRFTGCGHIEFAIFKRANFPDECWQGIAGGAEQDETVERTARREMLEEAAIPADTPLIRLDSVASMPASFCRERTSGGQ
jgi:8-oxo-dGTP pyrophosphatase MutT (NUDIX family)